MEASKVKQIMVGESSKIIELVGIEIPNTCCCFETINK